MTSSKANIMENINENSLAETFKKRKTTQEKCENSTSFAKNTIKIANKRVKLNDSNFELFIYIKVLLSAYKTLPNIIGYLDKLIEKRASSFIFTSTIYGSNNSTFSEMNHVIDLSERKDKLLNLFVMSENLISSLSGDEKRLAVMKWVKNLSAEEIAFSFGITERTVYRRILTIQKKLMKFLIDKNWTASFIRSQIGNEPWLEELYCKKLRDEKSNKTKVFKKNLQSKSSSSITS